MGLPDIEETQRTKPTLLKAINRHLCSDAVEQSDDSGLALAKFLWIQTFLSKQLVLVKAEVKSEAGVSAVRLSDETPSIVNSQDSEGLKETPKTTIGKSSAVELADLKKVLKKDFKIKGTVGMPGQKGTLAFSSPAHVIDNAERKEYSEAEICEEVVRAISPELSLRGLLEGKSDLSLAQLRKHLRSHYQEADATTL